MTKHSPFRYFKTSPEIIRLAVMLYVRFPLSLRNVEDLLHERGIEIYNYAIPLNFVHISKDVFDTMDENQQAAVLEAAAETRDLNWAAIPDRLATTYAQLAENNVNVVTSDDDDYRAALQVAGDAALQEWLESTGERGQALIDAFNAANAN